MIMKRIDNQILKQYKQFYKKDVFCGPLLENKGWNPSRYAKHNGIDVISLCNSNGKCLNYQNNYTKLIRENEAHQQYLWEALIKTYPVSKLIMKFKDWCKKNIDPQLQNAAFEDIGENTINGKVIDYIDIPDCYEDKDYPGTVTFYVPIPYQNDKKKQGKDAEQLALKLADELYVCGYNLANVSLVDVYSSSSAFDVIAITFEAKFSDIKFNFGKWLYHITLLGPLKKIRSQGLTSRSQNNVFTYPDHVYLFNSAPLQAIMSYAIDKAQSNDVQRFALLRIDAEKLQASPLYINGALKFYIDQKYPNIDNSQPDAVYTYGTIPPSLIDDEIVICTIGKNGTVSKTKKMQLHSI